MYANVRVPMTQIKTSLILSVKSVTLCSGPSCDHNHNICSGQRHQCQEGSTCTPVHSGRRGQPVHQCTQVGGVNLYTSTQR